MRGTAQTDIDAKRLEASARLDPSERAKLGQFMTPSSIANFMASLFRTWPKEIRLLDPGAGIGSLTDAFFQRFLTKASKGSSFEATAYEIDGTLLEYLRDHLSRLPSEAKAHSRHASSQIHARDFIAEGTFALGLGSSSRFTHAILNPPYRKIGSNSQHRALLRNVGIESVNLYTGFLALAVALTEKHGEIVAIVPRSFCNGTYFRGFREWLLERVAIHQIHVFDSRSQAFRDDSILQENIIIHLGRGESQGPVVISRSQDASFADYSERSIPYTEVVKPADLERFIHIPLEKEGSLPGLFKASLEKLGLGVATGPVVDFRVRDYWLNEPEPDSVPLLYAHHFSKGGFAWPRAHKKPNALKMSEETRKWLLPRGFYCVTKRFTSKEEKRRVVAYVLEPDELPGAMFGFENHLNVYHIGKAGLPREMAYGLATFLNSTIVDKVFRTFSGHTQVNATDLRAMLYPSSKALFALGEWAIRNPSARQDAIDSAVASYGN